MSLSLLEEGWMDGWMDGGEGYGVEEDCRLY
jgi:hypothetical protein